ncbi:uncharacterized protein [Clytia hemisphaerica]|uniref:Cnidarian restricted protein n=1 Tax=Clytia hemisphaerica TaxID=252671 RepID=A0A7M5XD67_9CNID
MENMLFWTLTLSFMNTLTSAIRWDFKLKYVGRHGDFDVYSSPGKPIGWYPHPTTVNGTMVEKLSTRGDGNIYPGRDECVVVDCKHCMKGGDARCRCGCNNLIECNFQGSARNTMFIYNGKFDTKCPSRIYYRTNIQQRSGKKVITGAIKSSNTDTKDYLSRDKLYVVIGGVGFVVLAALAVNLAFRFRRKNTVKNTTLRLEQITVTR